MTFPIEKFQVKETPFYYYDLDLLDKTLNAVASASDYPGFRVHYAVKANANDEILRRISSYGFGADAVSGGEIAKAMIAGFNSRMIVYAGVGKTDKEIKDALRIGIGCFNVESFEELQVLSGLAEECGIVAPVALRVNPEIDAHTHHYITTGVAENKFGIDRSKIVETAKYCVENSWLDFKGLHFHIGSQITITDPFEKLCERANTLMTMLESENIHVKSINVGGGLGIDYDNPDVNSIPDFDSYFKVFHQNLELKDGQEVHFELGRSIVGQCGSLISRVLYVKQGVKRNFIILDAGMTDLIRPALYQAHHKIENISSGSDIEEKYDVVGPICESSDTFGVDELLPETHRGDLIAIRSAGAYGEVMSSTYNCRKLPESVFSL